MKLSEIFSQLTSGELSQLAIGGAKTGKIAEADYHKVLNNVNLALVDLHSRFTIRKGRLVLALQPGKGSYELDSKFAVSNQRSRETLRYIEDTDEPFKDDVIKVEQVLTDTGHELALNVGGNAHSITTPSSTIIRLPKVMTGAGLFGDVPDQLKTSKLEVLYRATHPMIVKPVGYFDPTRVEVDLPRVFLQALLLFVASRVHTPVGMGQEHYSGSIYQQKYEQECTRLLMANVEIDDKQENTRAERNGWI